MQTHILIINHQLAFAVSIKQALERTGNFEVHPFTSIDPALEYLRGHLQDVALVDFTLPGVSGAEAVQRLRQLQPALAIIATPRQPESLLAELQLQGTVNTPISAREIIPVVNKAIEGRRTGRLASTQSIAEDLIATQLEQPAVPAPGEQEDEEAPPKPRPGLLGRYDESELLRRLATRPSQSRPPTDLPEYTSIDNVLSSVAGTRGLSPEQMPTEQEPEEQPDEELDELLKELPQQPIISSDLDQDAFNALLEELESGEDVRPTGTEFDDLVNSMRAGEPHKPLPTRHQQFVEFILTGGMDPLLEEIERKKTDELPAIDPTIDPFADELVEEVQQAPEPLPAIEDEEVDEGTVGDLFTGVSDTSFRNVLSILRGEEVAPEEAPAEASADEMREAFPQFFASAPTEIDDILNEIEANAQREITQTRDVGFDFDEQPGANTAKMILETALDESTPIDSFSVSELIRNIEHQLPEHRPKVQPLPSWVVEDRQRKEELDRFVREPDFLPQDLPEFPEAEPQPSAAEAEALPEFDFGEDWYDQTTRMSSAQQLEAEPEVMETEWLPAESLPGREPVLEAEDPLAFDFDSVSVDSSVSEAEVEPALEPEAGDETDSYTRPFPLGEMQTTLATEEAEQVPTEDLAPAEAPEVEEYEGMAAFESESIEATATDAESITDPYIAQLALSLTEVSLELTAEATLLTREGKIVAYAGRMAREELEELREAIDGDWDANPDEARIRFINLEGSGKDYMLFSRRTVDELTLSLVFSGTTPLRDIRRQGKRLVEALQAVPEVVPEPEPEPEAAELTILEEDPLLEAVEDGVTRTPYAYVWLMRDPDTHLTHSIAQAIVRGMNSQLRERSWRLKELQAKEEYIYLLAEVPGETPPYDVVRDLKRRAALIAHDLNPTLDPDTLWADSYLVVTPGRQLESDEIQQFIQFERML